MLTSDQRRSSGGWEGACKAGSVRDAWVGGCLVVVMVMVAVVAVGDVLRCAVPMNV